MIVYDIRDNLTGGFIGFLFGDSMDEAACRRVRVSVEAKSGLPGLVINAPQDFSLFSIGVYDEKTGVFTSEVRNVKTISELVNNGAESL